MPDDNDLGAEWNAQRDDLCRGTREMLARPWEEVPEETKKFITSIYALVAREVIHAEGQ